MIHAHNATFYSHSMFIRVGNRLYDFQGLEYAGRRFWQDFVLDREYARGKIHTWPLWSRDNQLVAFAVITGRSCDLAIELKPTIKNGVFPIVYVWRIQRWFRRMLKERRVLTVMMSTHWRLGERSSLACLPEALLAREIGDRLLL